MSPVVVLRPQPGATATANRVRAIGLTAVSYPLFTVEPLAWTAPDPAGLDAVMLTSANAVWHGGPALTAYHGLPVFAVGEASARAASEHGFAQVVLAGPDAQATATAIAAAGYRQVLHLRGEDARPFDPGHLRVTGIPVYRAAPVGNAAGLAAAAPAGSVLLVHSARAGARLDALVPLDQRATFRVVAISPAALAAAAAGWAKARAAEVPTDAAMLALARQMCEEAVTTWSGAGARS